MTQQKIPSLQVFGACGLTISVPISGIDVHFTCSPSKSNAKPPLDPDSEPGPHVALLTGPGLMEELLTPTDDINPDAKAMVISAESEGTVDFTDWREDLLAAKEESRPVVIEIGVRRGREF